jgi:hypothetical protein
MATAPSYATYVESGGALKEAPFLAALPAAQAAVDHAIWPNAVTSVVLDAYQAAICAVIDLVDSPSVRSERVGNTSVEYAEVPIIASAIRDRLSGTGLMYRGL